MIPQAPEFRKADLGDIHYIITLADGRLRMFSIRYRRAKWQDEATQILVQRKQAEHLAWGLGLDRLFRMLRLLGVVVRAHILGVDMIDLVHIEGNSALVSSPGPLRIHSPGVFVLLDIDRLVQSIQLVLIAPILRVLELGERLLWDELPGSQISQQRLVVMGSVRLAIRGCRRIVALLLTKLLEGFEGILLVLRKVRDVTGGPLRDPVRAIQVVSAWHIGPT